MPIKPLAGSSIDNDDVKTTSQDVAQKKASAIQPNNPLHGLTLEAVLTALVADFGWVGLAQRIPVRCFSHDPSMGSNLKFLRKTPWARDKVESLYGFMLREINRTNAA